MAAPTVTPLPTAPARNVADPETYIGVADTWAAALPTFGAEVQAAGEYANTKALAAASSANSTASDALATAADRVQTGLDRTAASNSAAAAAGSASTAAGWSATSTTSMALTSGSKTLTIQTAKQFTAGTNIKVKRTAAPTTTYAHTTVDTYNSGTGELTFTLASDEIVGSGTYTDWTIELSGARGGTGAGVPTGGTTGQVLKKSSATDYDTAWSDPDTISITRDTRTSNTQLAAADKGKLIEITGSGGFTQTFVGASTLGSGWFVHYVNSSTGDITLDPNSSETIGGVNAATTAVLKPGQSTLITSNGSNLFFAQAPSSFRNMEIFTSSGTFTPKAGVVRYFIKAVGGGGGGSYGGGAAGGYAEGFANITSSETVTIGAGGGSGSSGGTTSVGSMVTCYGGAGGATSNGGGPSNGGSSTFTGGLALKGADGGGHSNGGSYGGTGGASPFGGAGGAANNTNSGTQASNNTGSGGGGNASGSGGSGGSGLVIFYW